eukprot:2742154-Amphidinium_carterae.1
MAVSRPSNKHVRDKPIAVASRDTALQAFCRGLSQAPYSDMSNNHWHLLWRRQVAKRNSCCKGYTFTPSQLLLLLAALARATRILDASTSG